MADTHLQKLRDSAMNCDKGPILDKIQIYIDQLQQSQNNISLSQEKMTSAVIEIARHQERIISLAEKQEHNDKDIDNLYKLQRRHDERLTAHILSSGHTAEGKVDGGLVTKADNWNKLQLSIATAALLGAGGTIYKFITTVLDQLSSISK